MLEGAVRGFDVGCERMGKNFERILKEWERILRMLESQKYRQIRLEGNICCILMYKKPGFSQISMGQIIAQVGGFYCFSLLFCGSAYALEEASEGLKTTLFTSDSVPSFTCNISKSILSDSSFLSETSKIL